LDVSQQAQREYKNAIRAFKTKIMSKTFCKTIRAEGLKLAPLEKLVSCEFFLVFLSRPCPFLGARGAQNLHTDILWF
jgi:hypothetical protein